VLTSAELYYMASVRLLNTLDTHATTVIHTETNPPPFRCVNSFQSDTVDRKYTSFVTYRNH